MLSTNDTPPKIDSLTTPPCSTGKCPRHVSETVVDPDLELRGEAGLFFAWPVGFSIFCDFFLQLFPFLFVFFVFLGVEWGEGWVWGEPSLRSSTGKAESR